MTQPNSTALKSTAFHCSDPEGDWSLAVAEQVFEQRKRSGRPQPLGRVTDLGYLWCWECDPTGSGVVVWSDTVEIADVCEVCHQPLFLRWKAPA